MQQIEKEYKNYIYNVKFEYLGGRPGERIQGERAGRRFLVWGLFLRVCIYWGGAINTKVLANSPHAK